MKEIRIHGRGGQGAVTTSQLLAIAAFHDGKRAQAFPAFGVERRGAPVQAFTRISDGEIKTRQQVYEPDYVIVLDASLLASVDVADTAHTINVTKAALDVIGKPFVNTGIIGAFAGLTKELSLNALEKAIDERFEGKVEVAEKNKQVIRLLYSQCTELGKCKIKK
ncbi:MAG: 2-oxoacid:acceptor oxidoreductase family protein [Candidatus Diapherotrites archaeon]|uniref:pyruvate synthase n=1 Tax=Candidatus Iainarchaeum sp. TaxID=3101447 RepID=A0A8T4KQB8_9ARCH|nr:2-oxoacid:acceptor oxidoreductase family protein [Candidatus Diapherotrites archaeon]